MNLKTDPKTAPELGGTVSAPSPGRPTCRHCRKPIVRCDGQPSHVGCGSGFGWIHLEPNWGHSCQPRSSAPYAQPSEAA